MENETTEIGMPVTGGFEHDIDRLRLRGADLP